MISPEACPTELLTVLLQGKLSEVEACQFVAAHLTPETILPETFRQLIQLLHATAVSLPRLSTPILDCCGTGGSGASYFNTSTASAFVLAAGGIPVVKFGNRSVTSASGSFDFLDCLGIPAHFPPEKISELLEQTGLVFLYAPQYYPALKTLAPIRKQVGVKTVFNFIGPLLNPVQPAYRLLGVSSRKMQHIIADYLVQHPASSKRSWVIHSPFTTTNRDNDLGLDEFSLTGQTRILSVVTNPGQTSQLEEICFDAQDLPETMKQAQLPDTPLSPANSAKQLMAIATGADRQSACYQLVCLNAAAGFCVAGHTATILSGIELAQELMASGAVLHQLTQCRRAYERISGI